MQITTFIIAAILLTLTPGPDILFVIMQSISKGKKAGIIFALGLCTGLIVHVAAITGGVSLLIKESPFAFNVLKICGATYLIYLSIKSFINRKKFSDSVEVQHIDFGELYRKGILMNLLNPKVILFFLAFLPQFVDIDNSIPPSYQLLILGILFIMQAIILFISVAFLANLLFKSILNKPHAFFYINIAESIIYCGIGISILFIS